MRLEDRNVVVIGASSGIGRTIVKRFVEEGASIIAFGGDKLDELEGLGAPPAPAPAPFQFGDMSSADGITAALTAAVKAMEQQSEAAAPKGGRVVTVPGDLTSAEDIEAAIDRAVSEFGQLDVLVNCADMLDDIAPTAEITDEQFDRIFRTNVYGPMAAMRKACKIFVDQDQGGSIVNISSIAARHQVYGPVYSASKAALEAFSKSTAFMYMNENIRSNIIAPGGIASGSEGAFTMPNMNGYSKIQAIMAMAPLAGEAGDVAEAALFLASDESYFVSGAVIPVDGGWGTF